MTWYCVIRIGNRHSIYLGDNQDRAIAKAEPGSWLATGETRQEARTNAEEECERMYGPAKVHQSWNKDPSPTEIKKRAARIRAEWDVDTLHKRMRGVTE